MEECEICHEATDSVQQRRIPWGWWDFGDRAWLCTECWQDVQRSPA